MVDMRMLARRPVLLANITGLIAGFALFGSFVLVPTLLQLPSGLPPVLARLADYGFGASATQTGLYLLPAALTGFITGPLSGPLGARFGPKWPLCLGMALGAAGLAILAEWHSEPWQIVVGMLVLGGGLPMTFAAMANIIVQSVRPTETGVATGMNTVMRTVGGVIGGQVGAAILTADTIAGSRPSPPSRRSRPPSGSAPSARRSGSGSPSSSRHRCGGGYRRGFAARSRTEPA